MDQEKTDHLYGEFGTQKEVKAVSVCLCFLCAKSFFLKFNVWAEKWMVTLNLSGFVALTLIPKLKDESTMTATLFWLHSFLL